MLLARPGKDVLVLEAHTAGVGATGNSTAKVSLLQNHKLSAIVAKHGLKTATDYVRGNREGLEWLAELDSMIAELDERGGRLVQGARVQRASATGGGLTLHVRSAEGDGFAVQTNRCVLATGIPILDRGGFFARVEPNRSYCMAFKVPGEITRGMYISADSPTRSLRYAPVADGEWADSRRCRPQRRPREPCSSGGAGVDVMDQAALPGCAADALLVSARLRAGRRVTLRRTDPARKPEDLCCNGFRQMGTHTNGVAAALALSSRVLGGRMDWATAFDSWNPHELSGIPKGMLHNLDVGLSMAKGWAAPVIRRTESLHALDVSAD